MQAIQNTDNTLLQRCPAHNTIIYNHQIIFKRNNTSVGYIIYVGSQIIPAVSFSNKSTQLNILDSNFFCTDTHRKNLFQLFFLEKMTLVGNPFLLDTVQIIIQFFQHAIISYFSCIWNEREYGMIQIIIYGFQDIRDQCLS